MKKQLQSVPVSAVALHGIGPDEKPFVVAELLNSAGTPWHLRRGDSLTITFAPEAIKSLLDDLERRAGA
jgi:hypothetical protein